jgi:hypothetical protein
MQVQPKKVMNSLQAMNLAKKVAATHRMAKADSVMPITRTPMSDNATRVAPCYILPVSRKSVVRPM